MLAERLAKIKRESLWQSQWDTFGSFCQEMDINEATASRLITVYEVYVEKYNIPVEQLAGKSWYNLYQLRKVIPDSAKTKEVKEMVDSNSEISRQDLQRLLKEKDAPVCQHKDSYEIHLRQCRDCGYRQAIE